MSLSDLHLQTATVYASGVAATFTGSGGPAGYSPFTGQFGDIISSAGLAVTPFSDAVQGIGAGDEVTFVVVVENTGGSATTFPIALRSVVPAGFHLPDGGADIVVSDGSGMPVSISGDLFDPAGGLYLGAPLAGYDPVSGENIAVLTYTLVADAQIAVPLASITSQVQLVGSATAVSTGLTTAAPTLTATPGSLTATAGDTETFNLVITLPEGAAQGLRLETVLPHDGSAWFELVSAQIVSVGANLTTTLHPGDLAVNGVFNAGVVSNTPDDQLSAADTIVVAVTAQARATAPAIGRAQFVLSAVNPNNPASRWSTAVTSAVNVLPQAATPADPAPADPVTTDPVTLDPVTMDPTPVTVDPTPAPPIPEPNTAPTLSGTWTAQHATTTMVVHPFGGLILQDPDAGQTHTLTIRLSDPSLGTLIAAAGGSYDAAAGTFLVSGSIETVQAAARGVMFKASGDRAGTVTFTTTLDDRAGGLVTDSSTQVEIERAVAGAAAIQHNAPLPSAVFMTAGASGQQTLGQGEVYSGPVSYLQSQFIYDGRGPVAIEAQTPSTFIKNMAGSAAIKLLSGQNVVDAGQGSNFITGGTGADTFFLDGRDPSTETWDTIVNFQAGDMATLWGFHPGRSVVTWEDDAGAAGYTGRTMHVDLAGNGHINASMTFAGKTAADLVRYALTTGVIGDSEYMLIQAG